MDKKLTKSTNIQSPQNKQIYPTVQTVIDNTIKHKRTYNCPGFVAVDNVRNHIFIRIN